MSGQDGFSAGDRVVYVPLSARGQVGHPHCERGVVTSVSSDREYVYVRFGIQKHSQACLPEQLVLEAQTDA